MLCADVGASDAVVVAGVGAVKIGTVSARKCFMS